MPRLMGSCSLPTCRGSLVEQGSPSAGWRTLVYRVSWRKLVPRPRYLDCSITAVCYILRRRHRRRGCDWSSARKDSTQCNRNWIY